MEIKIQCPCGTHYSFDVEPVNGQMPVRIQCPACGTDGTDLANEVIRQQLVAAEAAAPPPPVTPAVGPFCPRHPKNRVIEHCRVCGKPICGECLEQFGYVCSVYCRNRAGETGVELPAYSKRQVMDAERVAWVGALLWRVAIFLVPVLIGAWIWYAFFGSLPHVIYSENLPHGDRARYYQFLTPDQLLSIKTNQMALFDLAEQRQLWSVALNVKISALAATNATSGDTNEPVRLDPEPRVVAATNDFWILFSDRLAQFDRRSGNCKQEIPLTPPLFGATPNDGGMAVVASGASGGGIIIRIMLADGRVQTVPIAAGLSANDEDNATRMKPPAAKPVEPAKRAGGGDRFIPDGADAMQMKVDLIERKMLVRQAMKAAKKSLVDNNLTAGQSEEASEQMINDLQREQTGGVEVEDASRYRVTLRRWPAGAAADWTGEVIGPPSFFALKTRGVLAAGNSLHVFDKTNRKLWSATLTYSLPHPAAENFTAAAAPPCVESGNDLYVFDRGMLTSFDAATGGVHWRLTSVGISRVQPDGEGHLYVTSTTASPDTIEFSQQFSLSAKAKPVILKVDAATGRVLWRAEDVGDQCFLSGKYVYAARATAADLITPGEEPILYFDLYRLNPSDGRAMWDYSQSRHPVQIEVQGREILLHFRGELQVLKFFSL